MTRFENKPVMEDSQQVIDWIKTNIPSVANLPMESQLNYDGTIKILEIGKALSASEKARLISQYPELVGREV